MRRLLDDFVTHQDVLTRENLMVHGCGSDETIDISIVQEDIWYTKREYDRAIADYNETIRLAAPDRVPAYLASRDRAWIWATCPDAKYRDEQRATASATLACELTNWKDANSLGVLAAAHAAVLGRRL